MVGHNYQINQKGNRRTPIIAAIAAEILERNHHSQIKDSKENDCKVKAKERSKSKNNSCAGSDSLNTSNLARWERCGNDAKSPKTIGETHAWKKSGEVRVARVPLKKSIIRLPFQLSCLGFRKVLVVPVLPDPLFS